MLFRQLFDPQSSTYTYLLADGGEAVLVDPVFEQARRDAALVEELGPKLLWTVETHVHADHVTAAWLLREKLGSRIATPKAGGAQGADRYVAHGDRISFGRRSLEALETPGHTSGCTSYVLDDRKAVFTGDALLVRGCGRTDFQQGDARTLFRSVRERLFTLPEDCTVYPGHDYRGLAATSIGEEKRFNPRLGEGVGEGDFIGYMQNLGLAHPKQMDAAVPANLSCGKPRGDSRINENPAWAPLTYTRGAKLIPLGSLTEKASELQKDKPVVAVCRSGARSAQATLILGKAGFAKAANLAGGMLRWRSQRFPAEGGTE